MAFLRSPLPEDYLEPICGPEVTLRPPGLSDYSAWAEIRALSRAHLSPWEPTWTRDELTRIAYRRRLKVYGQDARDDHGYYYFIAASHGDTLMGGITLSNVRRGAAQCATLGYWIGAPFAGQGYMQDAVHLLTAFAFRTLRLHRIEAACMPDNQPSRHVLEKCGFGREGLARRFLKINGAWEDHIIYALTEEDIALKGLTRGNLS